MRLGYELRYSGMALTKTPPQPRRGSPRYDHNMASADSKVAVGRCCVDGHAASKQMARLEAPGSAEIIPTAIPVAVEYPADPVLSQEPPLELLPLQSSSCREICFVRKDSGDISNPSSLTSQLQRGLPQPLRPGATTRQCSVNFTLFHCTSYERATSRSLITCQLMDFDNRRLS